MYVSLAPISWVVRGSRALFVTRLSLLIFIRNIDCQPENFGTQWIPSWQNLVTSLSADLLRVY